MDPGHGRGGPRLAWTRRARPHGLIVDQAGDRFFDEAVPADTAGRALYDRSRGVRAVPSFLIVDNRHRQSVPWDRGPRARPRERRSRRRSSEPTP